MVGTVNDVAELEAKHDKNLSREDLEKVITLLANSINSHSARDKTKVYPQVDDERIAHLFRAYERFQGEYKARYNKEFSMFKH